MADDMTEIVKLEQRALDLEKQAIALLIRANHARSFDVRSTAMELAEFKSKEAKAARATANSLRGIKAHLEA